MDAIRAISATEEPDLRERAPAPTVEYPLPRSLGACALIQDFLSAAECKTLIAEAEERGFASAELDYPPSYRNNDRQVLDDQGLAGSLQRRLADVFEHGPESLLDPRLRNEWRLQGINERLRLCRYRPGQQFHIHQDGVHHRGPDCRSMLTFMVYLTDGDEFEGGDTLFYGAGPAQGEDERNVIARIRPRAGSLILFDHGVWHAGETVTRGTKYVLRSDLIFHRAESAIAEAAAIPRHQGYIWALAALSDGRLASGGRDGSIRTWAPGGDLVYSLEGHTQSVLGLVEVHAGMLASISRDRTLRFWATSSGHCLQSVIAHEAAVLSIARLSDQLVATGSADHSIRLWSKHAKHLQTLEGHRGWVWGLAALGRTGLASVSEDQSLRIWDLRTNRCIVTRHMSHPLRTIDVSLSQPMPGTNLLATGDASGRVTLWTVNHGEVSATASFVAHTAAVRRVRFLRNGLLATCGEDNHLRLWDSCSLELVQEEVHANFVTDVIELEGGTRVSCGYDGELVWS
ncbi:2OG-Fe(II) oxygenase [Dyella sp. 2RAB6]|uniref:2OG-Fe(II) oxygenase n=1 Tax=Dyella sp. 2RAB6 TaxID=3232992 RepID=UPI003F917E87